MTRSEVFSRLAAAATPGKWWPEAVIGVLRRGREAGNDDHLVDDAAFVTWCANNRSLLIDALREYEEHRLSGYSTGQQENERCTE